MAFVNEHISDADKARIDFSQIEHPFQTRSIYPSEWTIDRQQDIALIYLGGGGWGNTQVFLSCYGKVK